MNADLAGTNPGTLALLNPSGPQPFAKLKQTPRDALAMSDGNDITADEEGVCCAVGAFSL